MAYKSQPYTTVQRNSHTNGTDYDEVGCTLLVAEVLKGGKEDPDYFRGPCGRYWASIGSIEPQILFEKAVRGTKREGESYTLLEYCKCGHGR